MKTRKYCPLLGHLIIGKLYGHQEIEISCETKKRKKNNNSYLSIVLFEQFIREYDWSFVLNAVDVDDGMRLFLESTKVCLTPSFLVNQSKYMRMINHIDEPRRCIIVTKHTNVDRSNVLNPYEINLCLRFGKRKISFMIRELNH